MKEFCICDFASIRIELITNERVHCFDILHSITDMNRKNTDKDRLPACCKLKTIRTDFSLHPGV